MAHFAQIDENNIVTRVLVIEQDMVNTGLWGDPATWVQTSYNTRAGVHYGADGQPDSGDALRKNFAGIGSIYDPVADAFYSPQPYPSWILNTFTYIWEAPVPYPANEDNIMYTWDEDTTNWVTI